MKFLQFFSVAWSVTKRPFHLILIPRDKRQEEEKKRREQRKKEFLLK